MRIKLLSAATRRYVCQHRDNHYVYIVMTLCDETLEARIKRGGLESRGSRMSACRQLCDGIAYLHLLAEAITHRDLKPSNILFKGECLKIADMGQSRVLQHGETAVVSTAPFCTALCRFTVSISWAHLFVLYGPVPLRCFNILGSFVRWCIS